MNIDEMTEGVLDEIFNKSHRSEEPDVTRGVSRWLISKGWHVAESDADLRALALSETDLVEPLE